MLGHKLVQRLNASGRIVFGAGRGGCGLLAKLGILPTDRCREGAAAFDYGSVEKVIDEISPDVIVNAVGAVKQKREGRRPAKAIEVNSVFPHRLAETAAKRGCRLVTISTDCVFRGDEGMYTEDHTPDADDLYGRSKALGEVTEGNAVTIRTSMIGREIGPPHGLFEWFLSNRGGRVKGFSNAFFSGFTTLELADAISAHLVDDASVRGLYHVSAERISKFELLCLINEKFGFGIEVEEDGEFKIDRSLDSSRFRRATGYVPPAWDAMIERMRDDPTQYE